MNLLSLFLNSLNGGEEAKKMHLPYANARRIAANPLCQQKLTNGIAFGQRGVCVWWKKGQWGKYCSQSIYWVTSACIVIACWHKSPISEQQRCIAFHINSQLFITKHQFKIDYRNYSCSFSFDFEYFFSFLKFPIAKLWSSKSEQKQVARSGKFSDAQIALFSIWFLFLFLSFDECENIDRNFLILLVISKSTMEITVTKNKLVHTIGNVNKAVPKLVKHCFGYRLGNLMIWHSTQLKAHLRIHCRKFVDGYKFLFTQKIYG